MTRTLLALTLALGTVTPAIALAQDPAPARVESFDGDTVTGTLESPMIDMLASRRLGRRHTLIQPRQHYTPEMLRSVENL
jgi:hypothetical protein